jgi:DNA-binding transcriptional MerR regulator
LAQEQAPDRGRGLAARLGVSPDALRYDQRLGLLPAAPRNAAGYRRDDQGAVKRLRFVKGAQRIGLRLREIAELPQVLDCGQCPCGHTESLVRQRLAEVDAELARLAGLRGELAQLLARASEQVCTVETANGGGACRRLLGRGGSDGGVSELRLPVR